MRDHVREGLAVVRAALDSGHVAEVDARVLDQVVGHQHHRHLGQDLLAERLAADPLLELRERQHAPILPREDLAVDHRAVGQHVGQRRRAPGSGR